MKKILLYAAQGAPLGLATGYAITILVSFFWGGGEYLAVMPPLAEAAGSEAAAVAAQAVLCAGIGAAFSALSLVWRREDWSCAKQTAVYFLGTSLAMLPSAWLAHWMEHSLAGFLSYFAIFLALFLAFWLTGWAAARRTARQLNEGLRRNG